MKPHLDVQNSGNISADDDDSVTFTFDQDALGQLMSMMTNMYENPELAVIREIATNALDSHVAAGNTDPIEIELPTDMRPIFTVRDHGVGMSHSDLNDNFSRYGYSSKRDTDDAVGMLGIGCKSPLAYTDQFTLIAIQDGKKAHCLVMLQDDGCPKLTFVHEEDTDEPDGVEMQIPVKKPWSFNNQATGFFKFWEPDQVLVDGVPRISFGGSEDITLDPDVILTKNVGHDVVIMGNVPYPIPAEERELVQHQNQNSYGNNRWTCVARVPIGTVNFTPSRESLMDSKRTRDTLHEIRTFIDGALSRAMALEVNAATSAPQAYIAAAKWRSGWQSLTLPSYNGLQIPDRFPIDKEHSFWWSTSQGYRRDRWRSSGRANQTVRSDEIQDCIQVVGFKGNGVTESYKRKLVQWIEDFHELVGKSPNHNYRTLWTPTEVGSPWMDGASLVVHIDEIKKIKLPDAMKRERLKQGEYSRMTDQSHVERGSDFDKTKPIVFLMNDERAGKGMMYRLVSNVEGIVVIPNKTNLVKFMTEYQGHAVHAKTWVERQAAEWVASLTATDVFAMNHADDLVGYRSAFLAVKPQTVMDPDLRDMLALARTLKNETRTTYKLQSERTKIKEMTALWDLKMPAVTADASVLLEKIKTLQNNYPLLFASTYDVPKRTALTEYVNAVYMMRNGMHLSRLY